MNKITLIGAALHISRTTGKTCGGAVVSMEIELKGALNKNILKKIKMMIQSWMLAWTKNNTI